MSSYSVAEAKNKFSRLIDEALAGEPVIITRHGKPAVELRPAPAPRMDREAMNKLLDDIATRARSRPTLGEPAADIIRKMRDGDD